MALRLSGNQNKSYQLQRASGTGFHSTGESALDPGKPAPRFRHFDSNQVGYAYVLPDCRWETAGNVPGCLGQFRVLRLS